MIAGIGIDIVQISRIEGLVARYGSIFLEKIFTTSEIEFCSRMARSGAHYAGRWAGKEAFYKALPNSCQKVTSWRSVEILPDGETRRPILHIRSPQLVEALEAVGVHRSHLSISHELEYCVAYVVLVS